MFTQPKSTVHVLRMLMHLSSGHVSLLPGEFQQPEFFLQSDLGVPGGLKLGFALNF